VTQPRIPLATIGYEKAPLAKVVDALKAAGIEVLIDVRAVAASRRAGFSKGVLSATVEADGVDYVHLRDLGTPKPGRMAARAGRTAEMREIFSAHMAEMRCSGRSSRSMLSSAGLAVPTLM